MFPNFLPLHLLRAEESRKKNKREEHGRGIFHTRVSSKLGNMKSHSKHYKELHVAQMLKNPLANAGNTGSIPGSG